MLRITVSIVLRSMLCVLMLTTVQAQTKTTGADELNAKEPRAPAVVRSEGLEKSSSVEALESRIRAHQLEIAELTERIKQLESLVGTFTATRSVPVPGLAQPDTPVVASANPSTASLPVPPSSSRGSQRAPRELLPDIGQIGAEIGLMVGVSQNPFQADQGFLAGGFIDLPLKQLPGGKLSYEIMVNVQRGITNTTTTSGVVALVNSALNSALGTPPSVNNLLGPLPVTNKVKERMTVLTVVPAAFKYTVTSLDRYNFRPYVVAGLGTYVTLTTQRTIDFDAHKYISDPGIANLVNSLLNGPQVAGLAPAAPELRARGLAAGQGDLRFGLNVGGGAEFRLTPKFSIGIDYRFNRIEGTNSTFSSFAAKPTIHF
ncbi:MAG: outer membrane beta-barrel protein [Acidobacteria bacterium]|nr:outer membrane beta-barrel protein [Acidobacteriota bacterium]